MSSRPGTAGFAGRRPSQPMSPLVGRVAEIDVLAAKLIQPDVRLLTLTGPGGVGKTRLALALLDRTSPAFDGRTAFISLAALNDPGLAPAEIARALGATLSASTSPLDAIIRALGDAPALLLIDNLEQIVDAGAFLVDLLAAAPQLTLLVTSRETLRVRPEHVELVAPLSLESAKDGRTISEAAELFLSRSRAPDHTLDARETQLQAVEEICRGLDGLPLAIELAAGRGRALSPVDLLDRLGNHLHLLDRGPRDLPARQRTLRDTVAWSYDLLTPSECLLFQLLAVFSASAPLAALEELWSLWAPDHRDANVLDLLDSLAAKSLVTPLATADDDTPRFALLETLRAYGIERLRADGRDDEAQRLHARWYLALAETSIPEMTGRRRAEWLDRLELDHPNFRAAMSWAIAARESEIALRFIDGLWRYWEPRGYLLEGYELGVQSLALLDEGVDPAIRARALYGVSIMPYRMGRFDDARRLAESCLALYRTIGDPDGIAHGLNACALVAFDQGDFARAESAHLESLEIARSIGRIERTSICLINLGILYLEQNRLDEAWDTYHQALVINSTPDRSYDRAFTLNGLGLVAHRRGELTEAIEHFEAAIEIRRPERDSGGLAASLTNLALVHITRGDPIRAAELLQEALLIRWKRGEPRGVAEVLAGLARIALGQRQTETAATLAGAVQALTERGQRLPRHELDDLGRLHEALQRELGPTRFAELIAAGRAARLETIVERAATIAPTPGPEPAMPAIDTPLTPREIDVLRLIAVGKSDREIGEALGISRNTVIRHVANIFLKLEVNSRTMAAMYAHRHGLAPTEP